MLVPRALTPAAPAVVAAAVPGALRSVAVEADTGTVRTRANVTTLGVSAAVGSPTRDRWRVELIVPVAPASCERLARRLGGGCGATPRRTLAGRDAVVEAADPVRASATAPARGGFFLEGDGALMSLASASRRTTLRVSCLSRQALRLTVSGRSTLMRGACSPQHADAELRLRLATPTRPRVDLVHASTLDVASPAREVRVRAASPTLRVGDRVEPLLDPDDSVVVLAPADDGTVAIERADVGRHRRVRVAVPRADSARVRGRGEQLQSLYDAHSDVWLGLTGLFVGVALSQLVDLIVERRR